MYSNNLDQTSIGALQTAIGASLERVFDGAGRQEAPNPQFLSSLLTPTGFPIGKFNNNIYCDIRIFYSISYIIIYCRWIINFAYINGYSSYVAVI